MREVKCPECYYPINGILCPNCKKVIRIDKLKVNPEKKIKKPIVN